MPGPLRLEATDHPDPDEWQNDDWRAPCEQGRPSGARDKLDAAQIFKALPRVTLLLPRIEHALFLLEQAVGRDEEADEFAFAAPLLRHVAQGPDGKLGGLTYALQLVRALPTRRQSVGPQPVQHDQIGLASERGEHLTVSSLLGRLSRELLDTDPFAALAIANQMAKYSQRVGLGSWRQVADAPHRLQALTALGRYEEVLQEVGELCSQIETLPPPVEAEGTAAPWEAREDILEAGRQAAVLGGAWQAALDLNAAIVRAREARGADALQIARLRFDDYLPLMQMGQCDEACDLLELCRVTFEAASRTPERSKGDRLVTMVHSALADLAETTGDLAAAARWQAAALQEAYAAGTPERCAIAHSGLARYLVHFDTDRGAALAHDLATALIWHQLSSDAIDGSIGHLGGSELRDRWPSFAEVVDAVEMTPGVEFRALFERLPHRAANGDLALAAVRERILGARLGDRRASARRAWRRHKIS